MTEFDLPPESAPPGPLIRLVHDQRMAFLMVGGINTVVGFGIFVACSESVGHLVDHRFGKVAGSLVTVGITHVLSRAVRLRDASAVRVPRAGPRAA